MGGSSSFNGRMVAILLITVLAGAMAVPSTIETQPEDCRLYQVTPDQTSPMLKGADVIYSETYISFDLLFDNSTATITIYNGDSSMMFDNDTSAIISSCQLTVDNVNLTLHGSCFGKRETPLRCSEDGGMNTILLKKQGSLLTVRIDDKESEYKVLTLAAAGNDKGIQVQVTSDTLVNTAFNCRSNCFQFNNAMIHSKDILVLSAQQTASEKYENSTGVIKVLHGEDWNEEKTFNFTLAQKDAQGGDEDVSEFFFAESQYPNHTDSMNFLGVSGSLFDIDTPEIIGMVPSADTYFKFENMDAILWTMCEKEQVYEISSTYATTDITKVIAPRSTESIVNGVTEEITTDDQNTEDFEIETSTEVTTKDTKGTSPTLTIRLTTERFIEEMSCKDTWDPKCTLTNDQGGFCSCSEAEANGLCADLENHPDIKENCNRTCGLCPDQGGVINEEPNVPEIRNDIEGRRGFGVSDDSVVATSPPDDSVVATSPPDDSVVATKPPPNASTAGGNTFVYVMIGIVVVMLLVLVIWLTWKKRKAAGQMDIEGQSHSMSLKESTEKTSENNKDTEKINKQKKEDNNEGAKNNGFQEKDEVKEKTKLNDEKANAEDGNKGAGENSPTKDENDSKNTDDNSPKNNEIEHTAEKDIEDKVDNEADTNVNIEHGDDSPNGEPEKNQTTENKNENANKGIADSLENEKSVE